MKDVLGNTVTNFISFSPPSAKTKTSLNNYLHQVLVDESRNKVAVRVVNKSGDLIGWNVLPRTEVYKK